MAGNKVFPIDKLDNSLPVVFFGVIGTDKDETPTPFMRVLSLKPPISLFFFSFFITLLDCQGSAALTG